MPQMKLSDTHNCKCQSILEFLFSNPNFLIKSSLVYFLFTSDTLLIMAILLLIHVSFPKER